MYFLLKIKWEMSGVLIVFFVCPLGVDIIYFFILKKGEKLGTFFFLLNNIHLRPRLGGHNENTRRATCSPNILPN
jgi:hypothetical protein